MYRVVENRYDYELSDHLGNVRAVISGVKVNTRADVLEYADYYALGSVARSGGTMLPVRLLGPVCGEGRGDRVEFIRAKTIRCRCWQVAQS